jgi:DtxR family transcriptional regulator, Mn-dependent transcriptional regulator
MERTMGTIGRQKLSASLEDYLEAIFNLGCDSEGARSKDVAEMLGVARSSVTGAMQALSEKGLANYRPYGCTTLTKSGRVLAAEVVRKHNILKSFFISVLGVDSDTAQQAACRAEHALGPEIIGRLLSFIEYVTESHKNGHDVADEFRRFHKKHAARQAETVKP